MSIVKHFINTSYKEKNENSLICHTKGSPLIRKNRYRNHKKVKLGKYSEENILYHHNYIRLFIGFTGS